MNTRKPSKGKGEFRTGQIRDSKGRFWKAKQETVAIFFLVAIGTMVLLGALTRYIDAHTPVDLSTLVTPLPETPLVTDTPAPTSLPQTNPKKVHMTGQISWYGTGENECLGYNPKRRMANGQILDDGKATVACAVSGSCRTFKIGSKVRIWNLENDMTTDAVVTDTGGFAKYNRILDVSKAVRDRLNMGGTAVVRVTLLD